MRLISFMLTRDQVLAQTKTQTRRVGSNHLKVGDRLRGVLKCQGRSRLCDACDGVGEVGPVDYGGAMVQLACDNCGGDGRIVEPLVDLAIIEVTAVRREPLHLITQSEVIAEGFPNMTTAEFVEMFCEHMRVKPDREVTVITFRYLDREVSEWVGHFGSVRFGEQSAAASLDNVKHSRAKPGTIEAVRAAVDRENARRIAAEERRCSHETAVQVVRSAGLEEKIGFKPGDTLTLQPGDKIILPAAAIVERIKGRAPHGGCYTRRGARHILVAGPAVDLDGPIDVRSIRDAYSGGDDGA